MKFLERQQGHILLLTTGVLLFATGLTFLLKSNTINEYILARGMSFYEKSTSYEGWKKSPFLRVDIYLFNWTNPQEIYDAGVKPHFKEIGPFRFMQVKEKVNITWNNNNTITYRNLNRYYIDENSPRKLSENITTINSVALGLAHKFRNEGFFAKKSVSMTLAVTSKIFVTKSARELLFDGYEDSILNIAGSLPFSDVQDKFGLFYKRNNSYEDEGSYNMWTKLDKDFGKVLAWNYEKRTPFYDGTCGSIQGSGGEFFPMKPTRDKVELYHPQVCKTLKLYYSEDVMVKDIPGFKFSGSDIFDNGTLYSENSCFCNEECEPTGVMDASSCREGAPVFLSLPHFYHADPYYLSSIEGLSPNKEKHDFYFTLDQNTGVVLDVAARLQINMLLQPFQYMRLFENVPRVFFPLFYYDQTSIVADVHADKLRFLLRVPLILNVSGSISILIGTLVLYLTFKMKRNTKKNKPKTDKPKVEKPDITNDCAQELLAKESKKSELVN